MKIISRLLQGRKKKLPRNLQETKKFEKVYTKSKRLENARCVWDLENEG